MGSSLEKGFFRMYWLSKGFWWRLWKGKRCKVGVVGIRKGRRRVGSKSRRWNMFKGRLMEVELLLWKLSKTNRLSTKLLGLIGSRFQIYAFRMLRKVQLMSTSWKHFLILENGLKLVSKVKILLNFAGQFLCLELTLLPLLEIQGKNKRKRQLESHGRTNNLEGLKEQESQEGDSWFYKRKKTDNNLQNKKNK